MTPSRLKVVWHWVSMGPYHFARMSALAQVPGIELTVVENTSSDDHGWIRDALPGNVRMITLSRERLSSKVLKDTSPALGNVLRQHRPDVFVSGGSYYEPHSLSVVHDFKRDSPAGALLMWSETTQIDHRRYGPKEFVKRCFISVFDGAVVAGEPHAIYLQQLGMPADNIQVVGNVVDNDFFSTRADEARRQAQVAPDLTIPRDFFLYVGRMIPVKNLPRLLEAYRIYRQRGGSSDLMLIGNGPQEAALRQQAEASGLEGIWFAGLRQVHELPHYYARAKCLVLPSLSEPWGLVVNEAMASGIPVIVSNRCGCAAPLVQEGVNGFLFDPLKPHSLAELFLKLSSGEASIESMGANARKTVANFSPQLFASRVADHLQSLCARKLQQAEESHRGAVLKRLALRSTDVMSSVWARFN